MKKWTTYLIAGALCFALGYSLAPEKTRVETKVVEVEKNIKGLKESTTVLKKPDGTIVTRTKRSADEVSEKSQLKTSLETIAGQSNWTVGGYYRVLELPEYSITVQRRVIGNISAGVMVQTDMKSVPQLSVGVQIQF